MGSSVRCDLADGEPSSPAATRLKRGRFAGDLRRVELDLFWSVPVIETASAGCEAWRDALSQIDFDRISGADFSGILRNAWFERHDVSAELRLAL